MTPRLAVNEISPSLCPHLRGIDAHVMDMLLTDLKYFTPSRNICTLPKTILQIEFRRLSRGNCRWIDSGRRLIGDKSVLIGDDFRRRMRFTMFEGVLGGQIPSLSWFIICIKPIFAWSNSIRESGLCLVSYQFPFRRRTGIIAFHHTPSSVMSLRCERGTVQLHL